MSACERPDMNDRSATLLVGVWMEDDDSFRARLTSLPPGDGRRSVERLAIAASPGAVLTAVHAWLDAFLQDTERHDGG